MAKRAPTHTSTTTPSGSATSGAPAAGSTPPAGGAPAAGGTSGPTPAGPTSGGAGGASSATAAPPAPAGGAPATPGATATSAPTGGGATPRASGGSATPPVGTPAAGGGTTPPPPAGQGFRKLIKNPFVSVPLGILALVLFLVIVVLIFGPDSEKTKREKAAREGATSTNTTARVTNTNVVTGASAPAALAPSVADQLARLQAELDQTRSNLLVALSRGTSNLTSTSAIASVITTNAAAIRDRIRQRRAERTAQAATAATSASNAPTAAVTPPPHAGPLTNVSDRLGASAPAVQTIRPVIQPQVAAGSATVPVIIPGTNGSASVLISQGNGSSLAIANPSITANPNVIVNLTVTNPPVQVIERRVEVPVPTQSMTPSTPPANTTTNVIRRSAMPRPGMHNNFRDTSFSQPVSYREVMPAPQMPVVQAPYMPVVSAPVMPVVSAQYRTVVRYPTVRLAYNTGQIRYCN